MDCHTKAMYMDAMAMAQAPIVASTAAAISTQSAAAIMTALWVFVSKQLMPAQEIKALDAQNFLSVQSRLLRVIFAFACVF